MLADHAAGVASGSTGLAAKARRVRDELQRQLFGIENLAGDDIGQRDLGGRDQVEIGLAFTADLEQVFLELRQLAGALQRRSLHEIRRIGLFVAVLAGVQINHELRQRAVQTGDRPAHQGKTRAGELRCRLEVQPAMLLAKRDVVLYGEVEGRRRTPATYLDVPLLILTDRHRLVRQVGNA
ncbi:hypothetical protein SSTU70S_01519 [Stutzerimonas stutzeri]